MTNSSTQASCLSRRGFLTLAGAAALVMPTASCAAGGNSGSGSSNTLKFWDMPWGGDGYAAEAQNFVTAFKPEEGLPSATYQTVQWSGFNETFASAIASKTGPAVSTGGGFQAFQYAKQGAIAYADNLLESLKSNGIYNDFLPNIVETLKTPDGYVAVPWALDPQVLWYRKSALEAIDADIPKNWDELLATGKKAAAKGYFGFGVSGGTGIAGPQTIMSFMINNGGGLFNETGQLDVLSDRNIEATEFVMEMVKSGLTDPGAVSLRDDNLTDQWRRKKIALGFQSSGLNQQIADDDVLVADPLVGPHGDTGALHYVNNIMMYTNTPSQAESEAFVAYFLENMHVLWEKQLVTLIPALHSVAQLPAFTANSQNVAIVQKWQPISKTIAAKATSSNAFHASIDGGQGLTDFAQTVLAAKTPARDALTKLHDALSPLIHP